MPRDRREAATERAREARKAPFAAERIVWEALRGSRLGFKFRREHPLGGFRLDFFCPEAMLAVEMDGEQHEPEHDAVRDAVLARFGVLTHRIANRTFFGLDAAPYRNDLLEIRSLCEARSGRKAFPD